MKIKVFFVGYVAILLYLFVVSGVWLGIILGGLFKQLDAVTWTFFGVFMIALPIIVLIWSTLTLTNTIVFDEKGVSRIRFGKTIRRINWTDIKTFLSTAENNYTGWIYLSDIEKKVDNSFWALSKLEFDRRFIRFHRSQKVHEAIEKYMPDSCKEKFLKSKLNLNVDR